jgi:predicted nucleotidyltransferase
MTRSIEEILRPPTEEEVRRALTRFAEEARRHYGPRLKGLHLFGSRARGDHGPYSDADVAVVLEDGDWRYWDEKRVLSNLTYDRLMDEGAEIQAWPVAASAWAAPETHDNPSLIRAMRREGKRLEDLA